jgi:hypothetical protein
MTIVERGGCELWCGIYVCNNGNKENSDMSVNTDNAEKLQLATNLRIASDASSDSRRRDASEECRVPKLNKFGRHAANKWKEPCNHSLHHQLDACIPHNA